VTRASASLPQQSAAVTAPSAEPERMHSRVLSRRRFGHAKFPSSGGTFSALERRGSTLTRCSANSPRCSLCKCLFLQQVCMRFRRLCVPIKMR
jgi:hypothetical protein